MASNFKSLYLLKWCSIFDTSPLTQFSKFNNFLWVCWFLGKNLSNFVPPVWKLHNLYCHNLHGHDHRYFALALHDDAFKVAKSLFVIITLQLIFKANYFFMVSRQAVLKLYLHKILWPQISKWKIFFLRFGCL